MKVEKRKKLKVSHESIFLGQEFDDVKWCLHGKQLNEREREKEVYKKREREIYT